MGADEDLSISPPPGIARFDSATAILQALALHLHGRSFNSLTQSAVIDRLMAAGNILPRSIRNVAYSMAALSEAVGRRRASMIDAEATASWAAAIPDGAIPALFIILGAGFTRIPEKGYALLPRRERPRYPVWRLLAANVTERLRQHFQGNGVSEDKLIPSSSKVLDAHYTRLADTYTQLLSYSPQFVRGMTTRMIAMLRLSEDDRLVDLGGGTGIYAADILEQVRLRHPVLLVDPSEAMLVGAPKRTDLEPICLDALTFSQRPGAYDKVLIKETIHHVRQRAELFANLHDRLTPGGRLLLVHVPPELDYPLFDKALKRSLRWHADSEELVRLLVAADFEVERQTHVHRHELPKEIYFGMVERRYMSLLSSFNDQELTDGLAEMAERYAGVDTLSFDDRFHFVGARRG